MISSGAPSILVLWAYLLRPSNARNWGDRRIGLKSVLLWSGFGRKRMPLKEGWRGRFFEDFEVGDVYEHPLGRTVTTTDNLWFTLLTQNTARIHVDHNHPPHPEPAAHKHA